MSDGGDGIITKAAAATAAVADGGTKLPHNDDGKLLPEAGVGGGGAPSPGHGTLRPPKRQKIKESIVDHTYRDYSNVEVSDDEDEEAQGGRKQTRLTPNFPAKLHAIVSNPNYQHIIRWQPHGRCWKIIDKHLLATVIMPKHFAHAKFESFNRSVNGWGFKRLLSQGPDYKCYYHECFLRGRPELAKLMVRLNNPGKRLPDKAGEPDFYAISQKFPLPEIEQSAKPPPPTLTSPVAAGAATAGGAMPPVPPPHMMFPSPTHAAAGGYMYGYAPHPSYAAAMPQMQAAAAPGVQYPQAQQMYWPGQVMGSPTAYQPNPYGGYYPYPHPQMMAAAAPPQQQAGAPPPGYYAPPQPYGQPQPPYYGARLGQLPNGAAAGPGGMPVAMKPYPAAEVAPGQVDGFKPAQRSAFTFEDIKDGKKGEPAEGAKEADKPKEISPEEKKTDEPTEDVPAVKVKSEAEKDDAKGTVGGEEKGKDKDDEKKGSDLGKEVDV